MTSSTPESDVPHPAEDSGPHSEADSIQRFAADLRSLRLRAASPTLFSLQHATSISKTVISDAFRGKRLPTARTVNRIVRALDADPAEWIARRDRLANLTGSPEESAESTAEDADPPVTTPAVARWIRPRTAILLAAAAFVVGIVISGGISYAIAASLVDEVRADTIAQTKKDILAAPVSPHAQINVTNGVDPAQTPCVNDAKVVAADNRSNDTKLEIIWSNKCYAGWGRVTRYDGRAEGNSVTIAIYPETAPYGPDRQSATEPGVQSAYTTLVVRPSPQTRLCAVGSITLNGKSLDLGDPICI
ncbi:DUF2690 domain-containing protein [Microbacterium sp. ASV81]|uniref:DUF2690 domain-containing protein n=1 Tax=Microbacterium capsulatum TaxID=3041921 RepID=A0ABU0XEE9_9MICO|nr:DUF2690 domain-containing protein [Microbacterium sp. ASV81]MDQ4213463.1 DUF2690 domain-containing protein [Microbacterium sp. ASV81]